MPAEEGAEDSFVPETVPGLSETPKEFISAQSSDITLEQTRIATQDQTPPGEGKVSFIYSKWCIIWGSSFWKKAAS